MFFWVSTIHIIEMGKRILTFLEYVEKLCNNLVGEIERHNPGQGVAAAQNNLEKRLENVGLHGVERAPHGTGSNGCVVCYEKHRRAKLLNPNAAYKDLPPRRKTVFWCPQCETFLCVGKPNENCWKDWHSKVQYWR
jgi:hypothetical protein